MRCIWTIKPSCYYLDVTSTAFFSNMKLLVFLGSTQLVLKSADLPIISDLLGPFMFRLTDQRRYLYSYYPERSLETIRAVRSGNNLTVNVSVGGKLAALQHLLSRVAAPSHPAPVIINPGAIDNKLSGHYGNGDIGTLTAWAWGYHCVLDVIKQVVPEIDAKYIFDERITLTMLMSSGAEGIGPWRSAAVNIQNIYGVYPYWSNIVLGQCANITGNSSDLPFDIHDLVSLVAPDEGDVDWWTNPEGVVSVVFGASKLVFNWLGVDSNVSVHVR
ncbi:hypothetical protein EDD18DRAFT_1456979 [Armillaria luteobubalina]|uniref:(4-O-methyl)-D-glucuronate--lignin esterase n=1 Tax=Armillaria luteobubalina TaxID=153913 RepID=A0AA39V3A0_9AGAR|nr:hypothetical protein EDD18DRAFT_1456979 [Armillaria luteobubalina]